ncbi:MAG: Bifunctional aspartokinase/homoserine dehydrogenase 1 [Flavobacteriaceae bacterium]|nr:MAG: Bifunctional aspartokinase/homoserine dehydrogenase 1 [Flavobacteriaceae bacterium]|tara:strand:- start:645 stop:1892 length:1248 start_codon:yes stop_codon:yes gene_type:complete
MQILKFGGASIKNSTNIKKVAEIINTIDYSNTIIIVSAIDKTTNAFENIIELYLDDSDEFKNSINELHDFHIKILNELFTENHAIYKIIKEDFMEIYNFFKKNKSPNYNFIYDQIISYGEILSSKILNEYLNTIGIKSSFKDVRELIKTDSYYRNSNINWEVTKKNILAANFNPNITLTQGFIASNEDNFTTTMGREASDYTAAVFAYCLSANSVTIWKDVDGILNADPKKFKNTVLLEKISYDEAIELAFYGASVVHPKTIQPLQKKEIPLFVKSYNNPNAIGTCVSKSKELFPKIPCYILKENQILMSISSLDFSFTINDKTKSILNLLSNYKIKINLTQNSAISLTLCVDDDYNNIDKLTNELKSNFKIHIEKKLKLYTVRNLEKKSIDQFKKGKNIIIEQLYNNTSQFICR